MWPLMRTAASAKSATTDIYHSLVASVLVLSVWTHFSQQSYKDGEKKWVALVISFLLEVGNEWR